MAKVTKELLLAHSRNADLETVFCLSVANLNLVELGGALHECINLEVLYAQNNRLSNLNSFDLTLLPRIRVLHLENNCITDLSSIRDARQPLAIEKLYLQGNFIQDVEAITSLAPALPKLRILHLQDLVDSPADENRTNPVCGRATYRHAIRQAFPNLTVLDGERLLHPTSLQTLVADISAAYPITNASADSQSLTSTDSVSSVETLRQDIQRYEDELSSLVNKDSTQLASVDVFEDLDTKLRQTQESITRSQAEALDALSAQLADATKSLAALDSRLASLLSK